MSILGLFLEASFLVQLIMVFLLVISVASWAIIVDRIKTLKKAEKYSNDFEDKFWSGIDLGKLFNDLSNRRIQPTGLSLVFMAGYREYARLRNQSGAQPEAIMEGTQRAMRVANSREIDKLDTYLSLLATIGSTTPYIGLFGTVWGIMNSFIALGAQKHATLTAVAPGIAEALIATAMGLFAAIPAVIFYNKFSHSVQRLDNQYTNFVEEFSGILHRKAHSSSQQS